MEISLHGRSAIVTGGSKGLGLAIATQFVTSGANVVIAARGPEALESAAKAISDGAATTFGGNARGRIITVAGDVAKAADIKRIHAEATKAFGQVDILVNNAGVSRSGAFETLTDERMQEDLDQKLFAAIRLTRLAWPQMKERRWGRVINVLNIGAKAPRAASAPTSISRAAGMALTKVLAGEGAAFNILVNALLVGLIDSDQHVQAAAKANIPYADFMAQRAKTIPLGRMGRPRNSPRLPAFWPPTPAPMSPERPSMSTAEAHPSSEGHFRGKRSRLGPRSGPERGKQSPFRRAFLHGSSDASSLSPRGCARGDWRG
jgi:3-oxoacyl-[acyl-carrier protein] reductase